MKQTNGAVTLLLSAFKSIYRNAYIKGIASAVVLTAGLAAGAAQANTYYWTTDETQWNSGDAFQSSITGDKKVAGIIAEEDATSVNGGTLTIGTTGNNADILQVSGSAYGGYIEKSSEGELSAIGNTINIGQGTSQKDSKISVNAVGGWAKNTGNGTARAESNTLNLEINHSDRIELGNNTQLIGAWASSKNGATARDNTVTINGNEGSISLVTLKNETIGGMVYSDATSEANGVFIAEDNTVTVRDLTLSGGGAGASLANIAGGYATTVMGSINTYADTLTVRNNTVKLENVKVDDAQSNNLVIAANKIINGASGADTLEAIGKENGYDTEVINSDLKNEIVYGAMIDDKSSAHNVTASSNSVHVDNQSTLESSTVFGAGYSQSGTLEASESRPFTLTMNNNSVDFDAIADEDVVGNSAVHTDTSVIGAKIDADTVTNAAGGDNFISITASGNTVNIGANQSFTTSAKSIEITGAHAEAASGAQVNLSHNRVVFDGTLTGTGSDTATISAAVLDGNGVAELTYNTVEVKGTVTRGTIAAARDSAASGNTVADKPNNLSHNSVVIGSGAEISSSRIFAVENAYDKAVVEDNRVTIQSGAKVTDSNVAGGQGSASVVTIENGARYIVNSAATSIYSDVVRLEGDINISAQSLTVGGYYKDGAFESVSEYNPNETTIAATADIQNAGTLILKGVTTVESGAALHATAAGAKIQIDGSSLVDPEAGTLTAEEKARFVGDDLAVLKISSADLKRYLGSGDSYIDNTLDPEQAATATAKKDLQGAIELNKEGVLYFTDASVELSDYKLGSGASTIGVTDNSSGYIAAKTMVISKNLQNGLGTNDALTIAGIDELRISSTTENTLSNILGKSGKIKLLSTGDVSFEGTENEFTVDKAFSVIGEDETPAMIRRGDTLKITTTASDRINIAGNVEWAANTLFDGTGAVVSVGKDEEAQPYKGDSTLAFTGKITVNSGEHIIETSGLVDGENKYTGTLDLSRVTLDVANGATGTLRFDSKADGVVKTDSDLVNRILDDATASNLLDTHYGFRLVGGTLDVNGTLEADFADFVDSTGTTAGNIQFQDGNSSTVKASSAVLSTATRNTALDLYGNTLKVDTLTLNNTATVTSGTEQRAVDDVNLGNGKYVIGSSLTSEKNANIVLEDNAVVTLGQDSTTEGSVLKNLELEGGVLHAGYGSWTVQDVTVNDGTFNVNAGTYDDDTETYSAVLKGNKLSTTGAGAQVTVSTAAEFDTVNATAGHINVTENALVTINGDSELKNADGTVDATNGVKFTAGVFSVTDGTLKFGEDAVKGMFERNATTKELTLKRNVGEISMDGGLLDLAFSSDVKLSSADLDNLRNGLTDELVNGYVDGYLGVGNAALGIKGMGSGKVAFEDYKDFADIYTNALAKDTITGVNDAFRGMVGAVQLAQGETELTLAYDTTLSNAAGNEGMFVTNASDAVANVDMGSYDLDLLNGGKIGNVTGSGELYVGGTGSTEVGNVNIGSALIESDTAFTGDDFNVTGTFEVIEGDVTVADKTAAAGIASAEEGATITFAETFTGTAAAEGGIITAKNIEGNVKATEGGKVIATGIVTLNGGNIQVGSPATLNKDGSVKDAATTGYFQADTVLLQNGTLTMDPAYGDSTAIASVKHFDEDTHFTPDTETEGGLIQGNLELYRNSALGVGTASIAEVQNYIAPYQINGSLTEDGIGSLLVLTGAIEVDSGKHILLSAMDKNVFAGADAADGTPNVIKESDISKALTDLNGYNAYLGANTAILVEGSALGAAGEHGAIHFKDTDAKIVADGGKVIIAGQVRANQAYTLFSDAGTGNNGTGVDVIDLDGVTTTAENGILVQTENGLLTYNMYGDNAGTVTLSWNDASGRAILSGASDPVYASIKAYAEGYTDGTSAETQEATALTSGVWVEDTKGVEVTGKTQDVTRTAADGSTQTVTLHEVAYSNALLTATLNSGNGSAAEAAARMAVYGGAVEAALVAGQTSSDAIASRMGMGNPSSVLTYADNADGAGIWLAPVYRNHESDGFDAQGVDYGADLDLYGVALGVDYTFAQGFRAGVMFNIGSGDADGQGAGSSVSNDFDYWGVGVYGGYAYENFSITADLGYTVVDNDLDASSGYADIGSMEASTDTESLSLGLTAQYKFALDALDITPHVGARFTRIDMDDYSVNSKAGTLAEFSADSMNVFSIPVGVSFSKDIVSGDWSVQPALDLVVTANTGDDEFDGDVAWSGVSNLTTATSTEVLDSFTYGANLGVSVKNVSGLSLGLGVNYVGSDNTDEFGAQASVRYAF